MAKGEVARNEQVLLYAITFSTLFNSCSFILQKASIYLTKCFQKSSAADSFYVKKKRVIHTRRVGRLWVAWRRRSGTIYLIYVRSHLCMFVRRYIQGYCACPWTVKALVRPCVCTGSPESPRYADVIRAYIENIMALT